MKIDCATERISCSKSHSQATARCLLPIHCDTLQHNIRYQKCSIKFPRSVAPIFLRSTDYVATLPARFIARFAAEFDLFKLPFKVRGYSLSAAWHPRNQHDPGHVWLLSELTKIARSEQLAR